MQTIIKIMIFFLITLSVAFAGMEGKTIEIRGKISSYNQNFVYLKYKNKKTVAPRKYVSRKELKSKKEIHVFVPIKEYLAMLKMLKKKH